MSKKNIVGMTISIVFIVLAAIFYKGLSKSNNRPGDNELGYYYDLNTQELFVRDGAMRPPIDAPSGADEDGNAAGVRAYIYGKATGDADDIEITFLEYEVPSGAMISDPEVIKWVSATSVNGARLRQSCVQRYI